MRSMPMFNVGGVDGGGGGAGSMAPVMTSASAGATWQDSMGLAWKAHHPNPTSGSTHTGARPMSASSMTPLADAVLSGNRPSSAVTDRTGPNDDNVPLGASAASWSPQINKAQQKAQLKAKTSAHINQALAEEVQAFVIGICEFLRTTFSHRSRS